MLTAAMYPPTWLVVDSNTTRRRGQKLSLILSIELVNLIIRFVGQPSPKLALVA